MCFPTIYCQCISKAKTVAIQKQFGGCVCDVICSRRTTSLSGHRKNTKEETGEV